MGRKLRVLLGVLLLVMAAVLLYWGLAPMTHEVLRQPLPAVFP